MSTNVVYSIIDRLLGGDGTEKQDIRPFSEIELSLLENMMNKVMPIIEEAWENVIQLKPKLDKIETNPQFAQIVPPNETIALITMNIEIGSTEGMLNACIPHLVIEPILDKLSTRYWFSTAQRDLSEKEMMAVRERILNTAVPVRAELGSTNIRVNDILNLQRGGDVIKLDTHIDDMTKIRIGSQVKFTGNIGVSKNKMAIKIANVVKDGDIID